MAKRSKSVVRTISVLIASGTILQAGSCTLDPATLTQSLVSLVAQNFISGVVFNAFNVPLGGGF